MNKLMPVLLLLGIGVVAGWLLHRHDGEDDAFREDFQLD